MEQGRDEEAGGSAGGGGTGSNSNPIPPGAANQHELRDDFPFGPQNPTAARGNYFRSRMHGFDTTTDDEIQNPLASSSTEEGSDQEMENPLQFHDDDDDDLLSDLNPATAPGNYHHPAGILPGFYGSQNLSGRNRHQEMPPEGTMASQASGNLGQAAHGMGLPSRASRQTVAPNPRPNIIPAATAAAEPIGCVCSLCGRDLAFPAAQGQVNPDLLPTSAVFSCSHTFHADCLERITPAAGSSTDPPCPVCHPVPGRGGRET